MAYYESIIVLFFVLFTNIVKFCKLLNLCVWFALKCLTIVKYKLQNFTKIPSIDKHSVFIFFNFGFKEVWHFSGVDNKMNQKV